MGCAADLWGVRMRDGADLGLYLSIPLREASTLFLTLCIAANLF